MSRIKVGLIGYGAAGAAFHAPLVRASEQLSLAAVSTSRVEAAEGLGVKVVADGQAILADPAIDLVIIATPNHSHFPLARAAILAGKHVVVDKPFTLNIEEADALIALARERERVLTIFHNRRWDGDFLTVRRLGERALGEVMLYEARWDRFRPAIKPGWREERVEGGGLLVDLGPHLIDQALLLFGRPDAVSADIVVQRRQALVDDYFELTLHYKRARIILSASNLVAAPRPRFAVHGTRGSFVKHGLDRQEAALRAGRLPSEPGFGEDAPDSYGTFSDGAGTSRPVPTEKGRYTHFYEEVARAILDGGPAPVDPEDARTGLWITELARRSAREARRLPT